MKNKHLITIIVAAAVLMNCFCGVSIAQTVVGDAVFVSPTGSNNNDGTYGQPLQSINDAFKLAYEKGYKQIYLMGGEYDLSEEIVRIDAQYSGISLSAYDGEKVVLTGAKKLSTEKFTLSDNEKIPDSAKGKVYEAALSEFGIFGLDTYSTANEADASYYELFDETNQTQLARWPNNAWAYTGEVADGVATISGRKFRSNAPHIESWQDAPEAMASGYFRLDYTYDTSKIESVDAENSTITLKNSLSRGMISNKRYYVYNLIEELDSTGEYYIDTQENKLYYYPKADIAKSTLYLTYNTQPLISIAHGTRDVEIGGITFKYTRGSAIVADDAIDNVESNLETNENYPDSVTSISITGCDISYTGKAGLYLKGAKNCIVDSCNISHTGTTGVFMAGGQKNSLTQSGSMVYNCDISDAGRIKRSYSGGIYFRGTGLTAKNNYIHDIPHTAIFFYGPENEVSYNRLYNICYECYDSGAIYTGGNRTWYGNKINNNIIRGVRNHIFNKDSSKLQAIYLDDLMCGVEIKNNIFVDCNIALNSGGGRGNVFENNMVISGGKGTLFAARATESGLWFRSTVHTDYIGKATSSGVARYKLHSFVNGLSDTDKIVWQEKYPELFELYNDSVTQENAIIAYMTDKGYIVDGKVVQYIKGNESDLPTDAFLSGQPKNCVMRNNIFAGDNAKESYNEIASDVRLQGTFTDNKYLTLADIGFTDYANGDYSYGKSFIGFENINTEMIGLCESKWRTFSGNEYSAEKYLIEHSAPSVQTYESFEAYEVGEAVQSAFEVSTSSKTGLYSSLIAQNGDNKALLLKSSANENGNDITELRFSPLDTTKGIVSIGMSIWFENLSRDLADMHFIGYDEGKYDYDVSTERISIEPEKGMRPYGMADNRTCDIASFQDLKSGFVRVRFDLDYANQKYSVYTYNKETGLWDIKIDNRATNIPQYVERVIFKNYTGSGATYLNKGFITQTEYEKPMLLWIDDFFTGYLPPIIEQSNAQYSENSLVLNGRVVTTASLNAVVIGASYNENGQLVSATSDNIELGTAQANDISLDLENKSASYTKLFLWNNLSNMTPLAEAKFTEIN